MKDPLAVNRPLTTDHVLVAAEARPVARIGMGLFATEPVDAGAIIAVFGGCVTPWEEFCQLPLWRQHHSIQIAEELYLVTGERPTLADFINHSCDPSAILISDTTIAARDRIEIGDEITYDYATSDSSPYDEFECFCETTFCREKVTGEDWLEPTIQERYAGYFAPYIQRRLDALLTR